MGGVSGGSLERRSFLGVLASIGLVRGTGLAGDPPRAAVTAESGPEVDAGMRAVGPDFPKNEAARVQSVVGASHGNFDRVRELVDEQPALAKASWDWGFGDWETALGAASHTGRREIAGYLIEHGARPTIFSAAMLGELSTVRAFLDADPSLARLHGPHGISLMRHARAGRSQAEPVVDYLLDRFGPDDAPFGIPGDAALEARYGGSYAFDEAPGFVLAVGAGGDWLMVGSGETPTSRVLAVEDDVFHPTGAPAVRLRFEVSGGVATGVTVEDGPVRLTGRRIGA